MQRKCKLMYIVRIRRLLHFVNKKQAPETDILRKENKMGVFVS